MDELIKEIQSFGKEFEERGFNTAIETTETSVRHNYEMITFSLEYINKTILLKYENKLKSIDVIIDVLKFAIPIVFTVWITSLSLKDIFYVSSWVLIVLIILVAILIFMIFQRFQVTKRFTSRYYNVNKKYLELLVKQFNHLISTSELRSKKRDFNIKSLDEKLKYLQAKILELDESEKVHKPNKEN